MLQTISILEKRQQKKNSSILFDQVRAPRIAMEGYRPDIQGDEVPNHNETEEIWGGRPEKEEKYVT